MINVSPPNGKECERQQGAGVLQKIVVTNNAGSIVAYDNTTNEGTVLANIDSSKTLGTLDFGAPYNDGLTIVVGSSAKCTVIYE